MKRHRLADAAQFRAQWDHKTAANARWREKLANGSGSPQECLECLVDNSLALAGAALILELGDAVVREQIAGAVEAARRWLTASSRSSAGRRSFTVEATLGLSDRTTTFSRKRAAPVAPTGPTGWKDGWSVEVFTTVLDTLIAFGPVGRVREAAAVDEGCYRSPELVAPELVADDAACFAAVRAEKAWVLADDKTARAACRETIATATQPILRTSATAMVGLMRGDAGAFRAALAETVKAHHEMFARMPDASIGAFTLRGLMLCRMARSRGINVRGRTYLPVRFLASDLIRPLR